MYNRIERLIQGYDPTTSTTTITVVYSLSAARRFWMEHRRLLNYLECDSFFSNDKLIKKTYRNSILIYVVNNNHNKRFNRTGKRGRQDHKQ